MTLKHILIALACMATLTGQAKTRKALYVIMDGVEPHFLESVRPTTVFDIAAAGHYGRAFCGGEVGQPNQTVTISAVGYTNILTGTWQNKHNVLGNSDIHTNYNYWNIFRIAKEQARPVKTAVFTSWTDNRTLLVGEGQPGNANLKVDYIVDGMDLDTVRFPKKPMDLQIYDIDSTVCARAADCVRQEAPDLSWVYLWYTDDAFHIKGFGDFSKDYLLRTDRQLRKIWDAVRYREQRFDEEWMVIVTTDHGREQRGYNHGGQSETERSVWVSTNVKNVNRHFFSPDLSHVDINPTLCRWLGFQVPQQVLWEQEGIPFIGPVDIAHLRTMGYDNKVILSWTAYAQEGNADIYVAVTNGFKEGKEDRWIHLGTVAVTDGKFVADLSQVPASKFYKFVVATPHNHLSRWYIE